MKEKSGHGTKNEVENLCQKAAFTVSPREEGYSGSLFVCLFVCGRVVVVVVRRQLIARPNSKPELIMENTNMLAS